MVERCAATGILMAFSLAVGMVLAGLFFSGCASDSAWPTVAPESPRPYHALAGPVPAEADAPVLGESSTVNAYLQYAALNNPGLEAAFNRWRAALERIPQATALPDPRFTYSYYVREVETRVCPQKHGVALMQTCPWLGTLRLKGERAFEESEALREQYEAARLRLFFQVRNAYFELYYLGRAIAIVRENRDLVKYLEDVARTRYKTAAAGHADVIRAQLELGMLEDRLRSLTNLQEPLRARLNAALNRPAQAPLPWPQSAEAEPVSVDAADLLAWMEAANPELRQLAHEAAMQARAVSLAQKSYWPDLTLGVSYIDTAKSRTAGVRDSGKDPILASVSVNVPLWIDKRKAAVREARRMNRAALMRKADRENLLRADIHLAYYEFRDAERKIDLYRNTLLPKANESMKATEAAYRAGNATFAELVDAERVSLEFTLACERALADYNQRLAKLEMLVGRDLPRTPAPDAVGEP